MITAVLVMTITDEHELGFELQKEPYTKGQNMRQVGTLPESFVAEDEQEQALVHYRGDRIGNQQITRADRTRCAAPCVRAIFEKASSTPPVFIMRNQSIWESEFPDRADRAESCSATLYGHSGAGRDRPGLAELADGGTFCPDEATDTSRASRATQHKVHPSRGVSCLRENCSRDVGQFLGLSQLQKRKLDRLPVKNLFRPDLYRCSSRFPLRLPLPRLSGQKMTPL
jgi:hypothetical protein